MLLDSPFKEIHSLRLADDGTLYAAAVSGSTSVIEDRSIRRRATDAGRAPVPTVSTEITAISVVDARIAQPPHAGDLRRRRGEAIAARSTASGRTASGTPTGRLARIRRTTCSSSLAAACSWAPARKERSSASAAILREPRCSRARRRGRSPPSCASRRGRVVGATSNPGKIFALSGRPARPRAATSPTCAMPAPLPPGASSDGGRRHAGTGAAAVTRRATPRTPDETWSAWSKPYTSAEGEQIASPNARYLQWRAVLTADSAPSPILTSVTAAYLPRNLRPEVASITVHPPGTVFQRPFSGSEIEIAGFEDNTSDGTHAVRKRRPVPGGTPPPPPPLGRRIYQKGLQTIVWKAEDANGDRLQYDVSYRREGETAWKALKRGMWDPIFVWDTTSVPDGTYVVRITASDAPSNAPATALAGDTRERELRHRQHGAAHRDPAATAHRHAIDHRVHGAGRPVGGAARRVLARRQPLADGLSERRNSGFEARGVRGHRRRQRTGRSVIIRATDAMNNVATAVATLQR